MKIYFSYSKAGKDGLVATRPGDTAIIVDGFVEEILGDYVLEKVPDLFEFMKECHRLLAPGGKATFTGYHYSGINAHQSPLNKRGISEMSLNFCSKDWREKNKYDEIEVPFDFQVDGNFAVDPSCMQRAPEVSAFWANKYLNVVQLIMFTLTKK